MNDLSFLLDGSSNSLSQVQTFTASQALQSARRALRFLSGCLSLDELFKSASRGNGLPSNCVLELAGTPGSGKTRIALSYVVQARLAVQPCEALIIGERFAVHCEH